MSIFVDNLFNLRESLIETYGEQEPIAEIKLHPKVFHSYIARYIKENKDFRSYQSIYSDLEDLRLMGIKITCDRGEK